MTKGFMDNLTALGSSRSRATFCSRQKPNRTVVLGDNSGRILDLSIYDCNMKIGPARRCSSPHRPILGRTKRSSRKFRSKPSRHLDDKRGGQMPNDGPGNGQTLYGHLG